VPPFVGTLGTRPNRAADESGNGIRMAMMELNWGLYEPEEGQFDVDYENQMKTKLADLRNAGMQVTLGLGLHFTPQWVLDEPDSRFIDQHGDVSNEVDLTFSSANRARAQPFLDRAFKALGLSNFWAVRISGGGRAELIYPSGGSYWAFGPATSGGADLPDTISPRPLPNWRPGLGGPSDTEVAGWYDWYLRAMVDTADWQMDLARAAGFTGYFQLLTPGVGVLPAGLRSAIRDDLPDGLTGVGAVWQEIYRLVPDKKNLMAYVTSMGDGSGDDDGCEPSDDQVGLAADATRLWSASRWISRIADEFGLAKSGENPGYAGSAEFQRHYADPSATGLMAVTFQQARSCGFLGVYWAHDDQLWDGTLNVNAFYTYSTDNAGLPPNAPTS
jgi:hypothetical protein